MDKSNLNQYHKAFQPILDKYDQTRRLIKDEKGINLMAVVVIGDQSHGKSSLLEAISGIDLPRGKGTKTRVPLEIQLRNVKNQEQERIVISSNNREMKEETIDQSQISEKIEQFTNALAGPNDSKQIVNKPITLTIFRKHMVDLTVIDLPGIVHNDTTNNNLPQVLSRQF